MSNQLITQGIKQETYHSERSEESQQLRPFAMLRVTIIYNLSFLQKEWFA